MPQLSLAAMLQLGALSRTLHVRRLASVTDGGHLEGLVVEVVARLAEVVLDALQPVLSTALLLLLHAADVELRLQLVAPL